MWGAQGHQAGWKRHTGRVTPKVWAAEAAHRGQGITKEQTQNTNGKCVDVGTRDRGGEGYMEGNGDPDVPIMGRQLA